MGDLLPRLSPSPVETPVSTDMVQFEEALSRGLCHVFARGASRSLCGQMAREEQPPHPYPPGECWRNAESVCHCGTPRCAACAVEFVRRNG